MPEDQNIGFQDPDEDEMPPEMKDHWLAAFRHEAGLGPHPGQYQGPPRRKRTPGEPSETDMQRAREEEGEASAKKMKAAMRGGDLGPEQFEQEQVQQAGALQRQATTQGASQASQAQAGMSAPNAPPAPSGPAGVTRPFPAQAGPGAVPTTGKPPSQPQGQGQGEAPEESESD